MSGLCANLNVPLYEVCNAYGGKTNQFIDKIRNQPIEYDVIGEFNRGVKLGAGSFGVVNRGTFPTADGANSVALKRVDASDPREARMIARELAALSAVGSSAYIPSFYGCSYTKNKGNLRGPPSPQKVYIVLELLARDLESSTFKKYISSAPKADSLTLFSHMFKGLRDMNNQELAHNDIKPANMMTNADMTRVYLIDLGLASGSKDRILIAGTPLFMPPVKFESSYNLPTYKSKDDMYSIALSIADILSTKKYEAFSKAGRNEFLGECLKNRNFVLSKPCHTKIVDNVKRIMKNAGYGTYTTGSTKDTINFTTLISDIVAYSTFSYSVNDVIEIMTRLIRGDNPVQPQVDGKVEKNAGLNDNDKPVSHLIIKPQLGPGRLDIEPAKPDIREELRREEKKIREIVEEKKRQEEDLRLKKLQLEKLIKEQHKMKKLVKEKPEEVMKIDNFIKDSKKKYHMEARKGYIEIYKAKKVAEELIKKSKEKDKPEPNQEKPLKDNLEDVKGNDPFDETIYFEKLNGEEELNPVKNEEIQESQGGVKQDALNRGIKTIKPFELELEPVALENDSVLKYYNVMNLRLYDLNYLVPRLHHIKALMQIKYDDLKNKKLVGAEVVVEKQAIEREEKKLIKNALEKAQSNKFKQVMENNKKKPVPKAKKRIQI